MNGLLLTLIVLHSVTLLAFVWAVIVAVLQLKKAQAAIQEVNVKIDRVLDETVPALQETQRALREAADTLANVHALSDNIRNKVETVDNIAGTIRGLPDRAAKIAGGALGAILRLGGRALTGAAKGALTKVQRSRSNGALVKSENTTMEEEDNERQ